MINQFWTWMSLAFVAGMAAMMIIVTVSNILVDNILDGRWKD